MIRVLGSHRELQASPRAARPAPRDLEDTDQIWEMTTYTTLRCARSSTFGLGLQIFNVVSGCFSWREGSRTSVKPGAVVSSDRLRVSEVHREAR